MKGFHRSSNHKQKTFQFLINLEKKTIQKEPSLLQWNNTICITASLYIIAIIQVTVRLLLFPLPSISLLNKIKERNIHALKAAKLLLENSSISKDIVVLFDEMYLQKLLNIVEGSFLVQTLKMSFTRVLYAL